MKAEAFDAARQKERGLYIQLQAQVNSLTLAVLGLVMLELRLALLLTLPGLCSSFPSLQGCQAAPIKGQEGDHPGHGGEQ